MTDPTPGLETLAIEIDSPLAWAILCNLEPHFKKLDADFNLGNFIILGADGDRWSIWTPEMIGDKFDHIKPSPAQIKFVTLVHKKE